LGVVIYCKFYAEPQFRTSVVVTNARTPVSHTNTPYNTTFKLAVLKTSSESKEPSKRPTNSKVSSSHKPSELGSPSRPKGAIGSEVSSSHKYTELASRSRPKGAIDSRISNWKYTPPTHPIATRPAGTLHPDSLNPKRTYNTDPPNLPQCPNKNNKEISIYLEFVDNLSKNQREMGKLYPGKPVGCHLPEDVTCDLQVNDKLADAVFKFVYFIHSDWPLRYCKEQLLITYTSEAVRETGPKYQQLDLADIRIDNFLTSDILVKHICIQFPNIYKGFPSPDPAKRTKAVALFNSDCTHPWFKWRTSYYKEVIKYIHVDSYGKCWHNVDTKENRFADNFIELASKTLESYRMALTFENIIQQDYITEKIWVAYSGGAIPVYFGPPDIYDWVPGNHTFIDPRNFSGPKELAEYMKRVAEDDELYKYHTSNFDWDRTKKMMDKYCPRADMACNMCKMVYEKKMNLSRHD
jgi:hypothetical protein